MKTKTSGHGAQIGIVLGTLLMLCLVSGVYAQEPDETQAPYFTVFCADTNTTRFPLLSTHVNATISGVIASVEMEQVYENSGDSILDATYIFPMSTNAAIYSMQMVVGERVIDAVIQRKEEAQATFDSANANGQTATLLEQHRSNVFQMSIANIRPGDSLTVRMKYTELIEPEKSIYQFIVPSIVGPRFTTDGESWVRQSMLDSLATAATDLNIELSIHAGMALEASCTTHEASFSYAGNTASCSVQTHPGRDFIVDYSLCGNEIETGLLLYEGEEENFFLSIIQPPKPDVDFISPNREYVFIMDVSGSMSGEPISVSKQLITDLLYDLNSTDKFNILFFAGGSSVLSSNSLPVTQANINAAVTMIDNMSAGGGTQLLPALERALGMEGTAGYARTFVILTDGYVTVEKQSYELIRENLGEANFFSFGIGRNVNREIIEGIAYVGCGESFVATDSDNAYTLAETFKEYIESPALTNIEASFSNITTYDIEPISIPDVFAERPIIIYGKYDNASTGSITLTGDYAGGSLSSSLNFADYTAQADENEALPYLWARRRIKLMSDYGIASNEEDDLSIEEEITQLGLQYSLVTAYTSFVAVDSTSITNQSTLPEDSYGFENMYYVDMVNKPQGTDRNADLIQILGTNPVSEDILAIQLAHFESVNPVPLHLSLISANGRVVYANTLLEDDLEGPINIDISELPNGIYYLNLVSENRILGSEKIVIIK